MGDDFFLPRAFFLAYTIVKDETPTAGAPATAPQLRASTALFNERSVSGASDKSELKNADILAAFAKDTGPAADAIKELLKNPSRDAAAAFRVLWEADEVVVVNGVARLIIPTRPDGHIAW